jgi:mitochondrial fission protein ELM1
MKILWLKDSKTGHLHKAKGLLRAMAELEEIEVTEYEVQWRWSGIRAILPKLGLLGLRLPLRWLLKNLPAPAPVSLILSAGGSTQWPNAAMAFQREVANVFLGSLRGMKADFFSLIAFHDAPEKTCPYYRFDIIPSMVTPRAAQEAARSAQLRESATWGLLIGGNGEDIMWTDACYRQIASSFLEAAKQQGVRVRIATSRRTPRHFESTLRDLFEASGILGESCWFHHRDKNAIPLLAMMGACSRLYVTADSMSMTHESVSSGRPVFVILPLEGGNPRLRQNLQRLASEKRVVLQDPHHLAQTEATPRGGWHLVEHDPTRGLAQAVLATYATHASAPNTSPAAL